jgi:hypothetical protein
MNWIIVSLSVLALISGGAGVGIIAWQLRKVRASGLVSPTTAWLSLVQAHIDYSYAWFGLAWTRAAHYISFYSLLGARRLVVLCKSTLADVEQRCSTWIETFGRRQALHKRGAASLYLLKIKEGQTSLVSRT